MKRFLYYGWIVVLFVLLLSNCVPQPSGVIDSGNKNSLQVTEWKTGNTVTLTRFIDTETGVICYYYNSRGNFACAK